MRRAVLLIALCLAAVPVACKTTQPPGTEEQSPIQGPDQAREPIQTVPAEPPGPAAPLTAPGDAGTGAPAAPEPG